MVARLTVAALLVAATAAAQTTTTRTDRLAVSSRAVFGSSTIGSTSPLQVVGLPAKTSQTACAWLDASGNVYTGACPTGTVTSVGLSAPSLFSVSGSPITTSGTLAFAFATQAANTFLAAPSGASGVPTMRAIVKADLPASVAHEDDANTFSAANGFTASGTALSVTNNVSFGGVASSLIPSLTDTYNLGSSTKLWNEGFIGQLNAVIFAESTATLFGGYSIIGKNAGSFAARVDASATTADFGKAMTPGHFVVIRAHAEGGTIPTSEYLQVGSLVGGTTYNVTRYLNGGATKAWPAGTSYLVNGTTGDGRIELRAYTTPQISILSQGATYNAQTELVRLGYLDGMSGVASGKVGLYIGDIASAGLAYYDGQLAIRGSVTVTGGNAATTSYADSVASSAQSTAISTAASDATTKANTAQTNAASYTNGQIVTRIPVGGAASDINLNATKIEGGKIVTGSITANEIGANAITADELAANAVTATKIDASALNGKTITGGTVQTGSGGVADGAVVVNNAGITLGTAASYASSARVNINNVGYLYGTPSGTFLEGRSGDITIQASNVTGNLYMRAPQGIWLDRHAYPGSDNLWNLGSSSYRWDNLYTTGVNMTWTDLAGTDYVVCAGSAGQDWMYRCPDASVSSRTKKEDIVTFADTWSRILDVQPVTYRLKARRSDGTAYAPQLGVVAEDLDALGLTWLVKYHDDGTPHGVYYDRLALYLIPLVREQRAELDAMHARLAALEARLLEPK